MKGGTSLLGALVAATAVACLEDEETTIVVPMDVDVAADVTPRAEINPRMLRRFQSIRGPVWATGIEMPQARIALGKRLFHEGKLSKDGTVSCASCHDLEAGGVDGKRVSTGVDGHKGRRNAPTVYNAAGHFRQFWDGRADTIEQQALGPVLNPDEMATTDPAAAVAALRADPAYVASFAAAFPGEAEPLTFDNVGRAIGAFERTLTTRSRWDLFLEGDSKALSAEEKDGLRVFLSSGCMVCHTGAFVGGATFERVGVVEPWPNQDDQGRFEVTKNGVDRMVFKVPSLRNVADTAPYFHDGSAATLDDAVRAMARHQLGIDLAPAEVTAIVKWLGSLSGKLDDGSTPSTSPFAAAPPGPVASASATPSASASSAPAAAECGGIGQPACPLQGWMRGNAQPALESGDPKRLEATFNAIAGLGPAGYGGWAGFAAEGARAARADDLPGAAIACRNCHEAYRGKYVSEVRSRDLGGRRAR